MSEAYNMTQYQNHLSQKLFSDACIQNLVLSVVINIFIRKHLDQDPDNCLMDIKFILLLCAALFMTWTVPLANPFWIVDLCSPVSVRI